MVTQPSQAVVRSYGNLAATDGPTLRLLEETDRKKSRWGTVVAVRIFRTQPKSFPWLENLIRVVKAIRDSSSAIPIPYIQPAAAIVLNILEVVQSANRNEQDLKELATGLVDIIESIRTTLTAHCSSYDAPTSYLRQCDEFIRMLSEMLSDLNHVVHKHKSWARFFRTTEIQDKIAYWRRQIDDRRNNFTLMTVLNINLKLYALPRELGYPWERSKPLRLVDAMNIIIDLPIALCTSQDDFHDLLSFLFRKRRGRYYVDRGHYNLTIGKSDRAAPTILTAAQWPSLVKPGSSIDMNIILRHNGLDDNNSRQCPTCTHLCNGASLGEEVTCPSCQTMFRVSRGIIGELAEFPTEPLEVPSTSASLPTSPSPSNLTRASDSASSRSENLSMSSKGVQLANNEARDTQYFRRFHVIVTPPSNSPPITMSESTPVLELILCHKPSDLPSFAWTELYQHEVDANVILPILNKCLKKEKEGIMAQDHFWIVTFVRTPVYSVKLILACTDGVTGKYPVFLFTPIPYVAMEDDAYLYQSLFSAVRHLQTAVPTHRIYSVFGRVMLARMFAIIWTQQTNIPVISDAYYHCKITYLTCATFELKKSELPSIPMAQIRPAELRDWEGVARLCYYFADRLPPFTLTEEAARAEARELIENKLVWVLTLAPDVVSLVAFARNSEKVATITKVFTDPTHRGTGYAERLLRAVCEYLLYDCCKDKIAIFIDIDNPAANLYQRVGFVGVGYGAAPIDGVDTWREIGFDRSHVHLGHW